MAAAAAVAAMRSAPASFAPVASSAASESRPSASDCRSGVKLAATMSTTPPAVDSSSSCCRLRSGGLSSSRFLVNSGRPLRAPRLAARRGAPRVVAPAPRCQGQSGEPEPKAPFGYKRKDVIGIGVGLVVLGVALKYGLEYFGVDSVRAGNVVQLTMVLGLIVGWISTYVFRVSSKEMTYAKQLKDYENKVMEKRLEEMPEAELETMLAQIEEEKRMLQESRDKLL